MESTDENKADKEKSPRFGKRHIYVIFVALGLFFSYGIRFNLSIAIVSMTTARNNVKNYTEFDQCPDTQNTTTTTKTNTRSGEFDWNEATQGLILSSFFYGYVVTQIPGGYLADRFGGKQVFGLGIVVPGIIAIAIPFLCELGYEALLVSRIFQGIFQGVTWPAMAAMHSKWIPKSERAFLISLPPVGAIAGNVVWMPLTGLLCDYGPFGGWPSSFYLVGAMSIIWYICWHCIIHNSPSEHTRISKKEKSYIEDSLTLKVKLVSTPWVSILTSPAVWALNIASFCDSWGFYTIFAVVPTYMGRILKFDMTQNGFLMALPNITSLIGRLATGFSDKIDKMDVMSITNIRRIPCMVGSLLSAGFLVLIAYIGCERTLIVALIALAAGLLGVSGNILGINVLDIGHNYAGVLQGISNMCGNFAGIAAPYTAGWITNNNQTISSWRVVFCIGAGNLICSAFVFGIFGKGYSQKWNSRPIKKEIALDEMKRSEKIYGFCLVDN